MSHTLPQPAGIRSTLRIRNFRLFVFGAFVSNMGTWLQSVALSWLVLELTNSAFWVSMITFAQFAPMLVLGLVGGVVADRFDRRKILLTTQTLLLISAAALALVAHTAPSLAAIMPIVIFGGVALAINAPSFQSFLGDLVPRTHVTSAISVNASQFSLSRVLGPALAGPILATSGVAGGFLLTLSGAPAAFALNAASFLAVIFALLRIRLDPTDRPVRKFGRESFIEGFRQVGESPAIKTLLGVAVVLSLLGAPIVALLPVFAKQVLGRGAGAYGQLFAAFGLGTAVGSLNAPRVLRWGYTRVIIFSGVAQVATLVGFAHIARFLPCLILAGLYGVAHALILASTSSGLQLAASPETRGRVMSLFMMAFGGLYPVGALLAGILSDLTSPQTALTVTAALILISVLFANGWRSKLESVTHV